MQIRFGKSGLLSTIQDRGRWKHLSKGVPISGAMDTLSAQIANIALGNDRDEAVIEFTYGNVEFETISDTLLAYSGLGGKLVSSKGDYLPTDRPLFIPKGNRLKLLDNSEGSRTYLAIAGGWDIPPVLGSKSTYITANFGGFEGRSLQAGDILSANNHQSLITEKLSRFLHNDVISYPRWSIARALFLSSDIRTIRIMPGREYGWFKELSIQNFLSTSYTISTQSNRMGYMLKGISLEKHHNRELLSTAVMPGTIQVTNNGDLILLMADSQTTGGYPRIAQVAQVDLPLCAQLRPGDAIQFREITRSEAEKLYIYQEKELQKTEFTIRSNLFNLY